MQRIIFFLPIALIALTLAGCAQNKSGPSLSSDDPGERLQSVRQTQDRWGAHKHAQTGDQQAIVGRWNHPWTDAAYCLFNADGTFKLVGLFRTIEGTYRLMPNDEIEFNYPGILYGRNVGTIECRLLTDSLQLKQFGDWVTYKRATQ